MPISQHQLEQLPAAKSLDLISSGLSVDETWALCAAPEQRLAALRDYRESSSQTYHFARVSAQRQMWLHIAAEAEDKDRKWYQMLRCGGSTYLEHSASTGQYRMASPSCGNRFCPRCGRIVGRQRSRKIQSVVSAPTQHGLKFLTISPAHVDAPLKEQLDHLRASFRRLRQQTCWRDNANWGVCVIEIKLHMPGQYYSYKTRSGRKSGRHDGLWHPHLHIIYDGKYMPQDVLLNACRQACGRECSVFVEAVKDTVEAYKYLSKYVAKTCNNDDTLRQRRDKAIELYQALYRAKTCWTWGKQCPRPEPEPTREPAHDWYVAASWQEILAAVRQQDTEMICYLEMANAPLKSIRAYAHRGGATCETRGSPASSAMDGDQCQSTVESGWSDHGHAESAAAQASETYLQTSMTM